MLPLRSIASSPPSRRHHNRRKGKPPAAYVKNLVIGLLCFILLFFLRFAFQKCDTRDTMGRLLLKTTRIFKAHDIEYWLDKGTLLGLVRDDGLIPWEYDIDLGVMNSTCDAISLLKDQFDAVGLVAYDRYDEIPHKVKLTYDTENHHFYYSDPHLHDPCIRIYDKADVSTWVDIYWYVRVSSETVAAASPKSYLIPSNYQSDRDLLCCAEGIQEHTDAMCCGGCVLYDEVFPLQYVPVNVPDTTATGKSMEYLPALPKPVLTTTYGEGSLESREIKGWKSLVCGYWTNIPLFLFLWTVIISTCIIVSRLVMKRYNNVVQDRRAE